MFRASNGESLPPCNREVYQRGVVLVVSAFGPDITEALVKRLKTKGIIADWHFHRNRIMVKTISDPVQARAEWWNAVRETKVSGPWLASQKPCHV